jgi:O-antigen ligase
MLCLVGGLAIAAIAVTRPQALCTGRLSPQEARKSDVMAVIGQCFGLQAYDHRRFDSQRTALAIAMNEPLGIGPGQAETVLVTASIGRLRVRAPHSVYVRTLLEHGWIGLVGLVGFLSAALVRAWRVARSGGLHARDGSLVAAALIGALVNGFFIDTLHWRHLWLLAALPWMAERPPVATVAPAPAAPPGT